MRLGLGFIGFRVSGRGTLRLENSGETLRLDTAGILCRCSALGHCGDTQRLDSLLVGTAQRAEIEAQNDTYKDLCPFETCIGFLVRLGKCNHHQLAQKKTDKTLQDAIQKLNATHPTLHNIALR